MTTRGETFRKQVTAALEMDEADPVWTALLSEVCEQISLVERLEANVQDDLLTVEGSTGQPRVNPLLPELRQQRLALMRMLQALGVDEGETQSQRQSRVARKKYR